MDAMRGGTRGAALRALALGALVAAAGCGGGGGSSGPVCGDGLVAGAEACDDGGVTPGDGCSGACAVEDGYSCAGSPSVCVLAGPPGVEVVQCATLAPLAGGTCSVTAGGAGLLLEGTVLLPGKLLRGGQVAVDAAGSITCVGCDCAAGAAGATRVTCPRGVVSPGLVDAHDHLPYAHNAPRADGGERYEQRHDWRLGLRGHTEIPLAGGASTEQLRWGELRHLLGGATSTLGAGGTPGLLRNLDRADQREGLDGAPVHLDTFPLSDESGLQLASGCAYPALVTPASLADDPAALLHAAEGIDGVAHNELACLTSNVDGGEDVALPQTAFVNAIAVRPADWALLAARGSALVWSPRSNVSLYGDTARVTEAARLGVQIALGTDWTVSGSSSLLRELACADAWNRERLGSFFTDEQLWLMVTRNVADASGLLDRLGLLAPGRVADVAVFDGSANPDFRAVIDAAPQDVALVLRSGRALYGEAVVVEALTGGGCDALDVCGAPKRICAQAELGESWAALAAANAGNVPAFACGVPAGEPTCVPQRPVSVDGSTVYDGVATADDGDGDGIPDAVDRCPGVFDPVRPLDAGEQPDADADGLGDACDPCPLVAGSTVCPAPDPDDPDADGITSAVDNCPLLANAGQADADADGKGDACDPCPLAANPGSAACPVALHEIKDGTVATGTAVGVRNALVTGRTAGGFFLQETPGDPGYAGADFSGIWVASAGSAVTAGDRVSILSATVTDYFGQRQLTSPTVVLESSAGEAPPAPVVAAAAEVATGGTRAAALEGVLVQVQGVTVADVLPSAGAGDPLPTNEFAVDAGLRVDDLLHLTAPFPVVGQAYASITGILAFRHGNTKVEPRGAADLVVGP